jgi:hypothetical protein
MAPFFKFLCAFVVAILVVMSAGDHSGAMAARPGLPHGTDTEASLDGRSGRRLAVSPWSTTRRSTGATSSGKSNNPNNHN